VNNGKPEMVKVLIDNGADANLGGLLGISVLHLAVNNQRIPLETIALLVESGADLNAKSFGLTPLNLAVSLERIDVIGLLQSQGANQDDFFNENRHERKNRPNFYKVLGLKSSASERDIKKRYRKLIFDVHPDRHSDEDEDEKKILGSRCEAINEAYQNLSNAENRKKHDAEIQQGLWA